MNTFVSSVPEESPTFVRGYPFNSTAIHISWNGLPPSRHKEQLLGYRVRYRRLGSLLFEEAANTTSNMTEIVVFNLVSQTKYEIEINGFNEIGHGPTSKILVIKTLSYGESKMIAVFFMHAEYYIMVLSLILSLLTVKNSGDLSLQYYDVLVDVFVCCNCCFGFPILFLGEVSIDVTLQLVMDADFSSDLLNRTSSKFVTIEENIKTSVSSIPNKEWLMCTFTCTLFLEKTCFKCCAIYMPRLLR